MGTSKTSSRPTSRRTRQGIPPAANVCSGNSARMRLCDLTQTVAPEEEELVNWDHYQCGSSLCDPSFPQKENKGPVTTHKEREQLALDDAPSTSGQMFCFLECVLSSL